MTAKEYLNQAYRLEQRIKLAKMEIEDLQELSCSVSSPGFEEHYNATRNTEAPFVKTLYKIMEMQDKVNKELDLLLKLKEEIKQVIMELSDQDEILVLKYRYLYNWAWARIGDEIYADERTVRRWHNRALSHIRVPDNPTIVK
jgi:DNA-directed RNA polymerase specialized sigma24 family protein